MKEASADQRCHRISSHAGIRSSAFTEGCPSAIGLCTAGVFEGDRLLRGTTLFVGDAAVPSAGMPDFEPPSTLSYTGRITITTRFGTLTTRDTGIFDTAGTGLFASRDLVIGGTGIFAGASGTIFFTGTGVTTFDADASGEICLAH
jgi:hypothetical protein